MTNYKHGQKTCREFNREFEGVKPKQEHGLAFVPSTTTDIITRDGTSVTEDEIAFMEAREYKLKYTFLYEGVNGAPAYLLSLWKRKV